MSPTGLCATARLDNRSDGAPALPALPHVSALAPARTPRLFLRHAASALSLALAPAPLCAYPACPASHFGICILWTHSRTDDGPTRDAGHLASVGPSVLGRRSQRLIHACGGAKQAGGHDNDASGCRATEPLPSCTFGHYLRIRAIEADEGDARKRRRHQGARTFVVRRGFEPKRAGQFALAGHSVRKPRCCCPSRRAAQAGGTQSRSCLGRTLCVLCLSLVDPKYPTLSFSRGVPCARGTPSYGSRVTGLDAVMWLCVRAAVLARHSPEYRFVKDRGGSLRSETRAGCVHCAQPGP